MRRWLALLIGALAIAFAGTALALTAPSASNDQVVAEETEGGAKDEVGTVVPIHLEEIPEGMLAGDDLPTASDIKEESVQKEQTEEQPVEEKTKNTEPPEKEQRDDTPPEIAILYPKDGQVFEKKEVVFEGQTEPGARVFAGKYEADVSETGAWRIVLYLSPGKNKVTFEAKDRAGNTGTDSITLIYERQEEPKEEPRDEKPKEEPKEEPKDEEPKEEPKEEPREEVGDWKFAAHQVYGECSETPPFDVFHGTGKPGTLIKVVSEYGSATTEVGDHGEWEIKVVFETAPVGKTFVVKAKDQFEHVKEFQFTRTG